MLALQFVEDRNLRTVARFPAFPCPSDRMLQCERQGTGRRLQALQSIKQKLRQKDLPESIARYRT
ncbi:hypothetical protein CK230_06260 [Mesorhizobium sp. WSM3859]|nr:hypothetical protein CK230_06260 [Mesorhizobium sp. WSM3859]